MNHFTTLHNTIWCTQCNTKRLIQCILCWKVKSHSQQSVTQGGETTAVIVSLLFWNVSIWWIYILDGFLLVDEIDPNCQGAVSFFQTSLSCNEKLTWYPFLWLTYSTGHTGDKTSVVQNNNITNWYYKKVMASNMQVIT